ncbi:hypothetical protein EBR03_07740 [bacterium]|nr:hypothetical protein [bacterium]NBW99448.1 hypothetical protein [bacterium]NBX82368.1 hypothetical protein [bacterium]
MRKGRHHRATPLGPVIRDVPETFFRLCHYCLHLNEGDSEILICQKCETDFLPNAEAASDEISEMNDEEEERGPALPKPQLNGLNVKW